MREKTGPELYLRLACERVLASEHGDGMQGGEVGAIAGALVAGELLPENEVRGVLDEYATAVRARSGHVPPVLMRAPQAGQHRELAQCRVVLGPFVVPQDGTTGVVLEKVRFEDDSAEFELSGTDASLLRVRHGRPFPQPRAWGRPIAVTDDRGATATARNHGGGGWGGGSWNATFKTDKPLSPATSWLELDGARVHFPRPPAPSDVLVEPVEAPPPLRWALYVAMSGAFNFPRGHTGSVQAALSTFVATGALEADDPLVAEFGAVSEALEKRTPKRGLPEPWPKLMRRLGKADGAQGHLAVAAACQVAGISLRIDSLSSEPEGFSVLATASPGDVFRRGFPFHQMGPAASQLLWWAEDDRHNLYFGTGLSAGGGGYPDKAEGSVDFHAALDPKARQLRLIPTGRSERAVVTVRTEGLGGHK